MVGDLVLFSVKMFLRHLVPWPSVHIQLKFYGDLPEEPRRRGGGLNAKGVAKYSHFGALGGHISIS